MSTYYSDRARFWLKYAEDSDLTASELKETGGARFSARLHVE